MTLTIARQQELRAQIDSLSQQLAAGELMWASGYFAGLATAGGQLAAPAAPQAGTSETLTIWYGTDTGNARGIATRLADAAKARGYTVELMRLDEVKPRNITKVKALLVVIATHGEGEPPEDSEAFYRFIMSDRAPKLADLKFAIFGLGDSSYPDFCQTSRELDARFAELGATRLLDLVDSDVDFETHEAGWREQALEKVEPVLGAQSGGQPEHLKLVSSTPAFDRQNPFQAEVLERSALTVSPSNKQVAHLELLLEDSGLTYLPGDSLGVWVENDKRLVDEVIELINADPNTLVTRDNKEQTLADWLTKDLEITQVVRPFVAAWAELSGSTELAALLEDREGLQAWTEVRQVPDVIKAYPAEATAQQLVDALRRIAPRLYSIASSPLASEDEVHLTVRLEGGETADGLRAGCATWQLLNRVAVGDTLPVYIEPNDRFRLPEEGHKPVIMVGPGTGVAPFRGFLQHRQELGHEGRNWLFFGEQHKRTDFLYQIEWQRFLRDGVLDRLTVAFSRDQAEKIYVQHRLLEQGADVYQWLEDGAHFYVCGDGQGMAEDVEQALISIVKEHGGKTEEAAREYVEKLRQERRYQKDVY